MWVGIKALRQKWEIKASLTINWEQAWIPEIRRFSI
jgi:hypothetical protein